VEIVCYLGGLTYTTFPKMFAPSISSRIRWKTQRQPTRFTNCGLQVFDRSIRTGFTLLELLIVVGIISLLLLLIAPAFTYSKGGNDVASAAYTVKGVLETARTYAKANNTYVWVGFYEEDVSQSSTNPATAGIGRLVMSIVASKNGTTVYNPNSVTNP